MMVHLMAQLLRRHVFRGIGLSFPLPGHGGGPLDGMFGTAKTLLERRHMSSPLQMREILASRGIDVCVLDILLNTHQGVPKAHSLDFRCPGISSLTKFYAWRLFPLPTGIGFQARQYLGTALHGSKRRKKTAQVQQAEAQPYVPADPAEDWASLPDAWVGNESEGVHIVVPSSAPLPSLAFYEPVLLSEMTAAINSILDSNVLLTAPTRDVNFWRSLPSAITGHPSPPYDWPEPLQDDQVLLSDHYTARIAAKLNLSATQLQDVYAQPLSYFLSGKRFREDVAAMKHSQRKQRGLTVVAGRLKATNTRRQKRQRCHDADYEGANDDDENVHDYVVLYSPLFSSQLTCAQTANLLSDNEDEARLEVEQTEEEEAEDDEEHTPSH